MERNLYTFGDLAVARKLDKINESNVLIRINKLVNWDRLKVILSVVDSRNTSYYGRDCYDPLVMFKALFLQALYSFSDRDLEEHLNFNILFMQFCGFSIESEIPDHSTIARWRERFSDGNVYEKAFFELNSQLEQKGLELKNAMIVDASLVQSKSRPRKKVIIESETTGDEENITDSPADNIATSTVVTVHIEESKDHEARWLKKGNKSYYGYKQHLSVNRDGFINGLLTTTANVSDTKMLVALVEQVNPPEKIELMADKGYPSMDNNKFLESRKLNNRIMIKHKPKQVKDRIIIEYNKSISKARYVVERTFGSIKRNLGGGRSWYIGLYKTHNFNLIRAIAYNLTRASNYVFE